MTADAVVELLKRRGQTLAVAESLTGGLLGATITAVPGASTVFVGGVVSYATRIKVKVLGVPERLIAENSVISGEVAGAMASGVRALLDADWGVALTGVAGPDPQDGHAPGEVWLAVVGPNRSAIERLDALGDRSRVREGAVDAACALLGNVIATV